MTIPSRDELEESYKKNWNYAGYNFVLCEQYVTGEDSGSSVFTDKFLSKQCVLNYRAIIVNENKESVFSMDSPVLWYDNVQNETFTGRVAYLYLIELLEQFRRKGIGTAYANAQHATLPEYGIKAIYVKASYWGPYFWSKMGYQFIDEGMFWNHYEEYCAGNGDKCADLLSIEEIPVDYFESLREIEYPMFRKLSD